jgi:hypothetical protein
MTGLSNGLKANGVMSAATAWIRMKPDVLPMESSPIAEPAPRTAEPLDQHGAVTRPDVILGTHRVRSWSRFAG